MKFIIGFGLFLLVLGFASFNLIDWRDASFKSGQDEQNYKYVYQDGKLQTQTLLTQEQLKIQTDSGCTQNCHKEFR